MNFDPRQSFLLFILPTIIASYSYALHIEIEETKAIAIELKERSAFLDRSIKYWLPELTCQSCHTLRNKNGGKF